MKYLKIEAEQIEDIEKLIKVVKENILFNTNILDRIFTVLSKLPQDQSCEDLSNYETLMDFYEKTHICHPSSVARMFTLDNEFFRVCGKKKGSRYLINTKEAIDYLSNCNYPRIKSRAKKYIKHQAEYAN